MPAFSRLRYTQESLVLFEVNLLHERFLAKAVRAGNPLYLTYDALDAQTRTARLNAYDVNRFAQIQPTAETEADLKRLGLRFVPTGRGFLVAGCPGAQSASGLYKPETPVPASLELRFALRFTDALFFNYTSAARVAPAGEVWDFNNLAHASTPLLHSGAYADFAQSAPMADFTATSGAGMHGIIRIKANTSGRAFANYLDNNGYVRRVSNAPVTYSLLLDARRTVWRYRRTDGSVIGESTTALPLIADVIAPVPLAAGVQYLPNPEASLIHPQPNGSYVSEVLI